MTPQMWGSFDLGTKVLGSPRVAAFYNAREAAFIAPWDLETSRMHADSHILFPPTSIPRLARARGLAWRELVDQVVAAPADDPQNLAFSLLMIRLDGCLGCEMDSYRALRGCTACAQQTLQRFKGTDEDLLARYRKALDDISGYLATHPQPETLEILAPARAA